MAQVDVRRDNRLSFRRIMLHLYRTLSPNIGTSRLVAVAKLLVKTEESAVYARCEVIIDSAATVSCRCLIQGLNFKR